MYTDIKAKNFNITDIKGLTENQVNQHLKLYNGYITKVNEISKASKDPETYTGSNPTYSAMRALKQGETFALNGVKLHELYFENLSCDADCSFKKDSKIATIIEEQFCGYESFLAYLKQVALSVRGWAVVAIDDVTNRLRVLGLDAHDVGAIFGATPLLVIDVYEHAYFINYGTDRAAYLDSIFKSINWNVIDCRLAKCCCKNEK